MRGEDILGWHYVSPHAVGHINEFKVVEMRRKIQFFCNFSPQILNLFALWEVGIRIPFF